MVDENQEFVDKPSCIYLKVLIDRWQIQIWWTKLVTHTDGVLHNTHNHKVSAGPDETIQVSAHKIWHNMTNPSWIQLLHGATWIK